MIITTAPGNMLQRKMRRYYRVQTIHTYGIRSPLERRVVQSNWGQTLNKLQQKVFQRIMAHSDVLNNISKVPKNRSSGRPRKTEKKIPIQSLYEKPQGTQFM